MKRHAMLMIVGLAAAFAGSARAQDEDIVVVTATKTQRQRLEIPVSIAVLTTPDVNSSAARNIDDILRNVPGISVLRSVGMGHGMPTQIHVRGVPGDHRTLILLDGIPLNEITSGFNNINAIPMHAVKQVEIVRGPFSNLYGTDAFAGVVNVITADGVGQNGNGIWGAVGNGDFFDVGAGINGATGAVSYSASAGYRSIGNYMARDYIIERIYDRDAQQYMDIRKEQANYDYTDTRTLAKVSVDLGEDATVAITARLFDTLLGYGQKDLRPLYPEPEDNITATRSAVIGLSYNASLFPNADFRTALYYRDQHRELWGLDFSHFTEAGAPAYARSYMENSGNEWRAEIGIDMAAGRSHVLSAGLDFFRDTGDFSALVDDVTRVPLGGSEGALEHIWNSGLYIQDEMNIGDRCKAMAGVRIDYHSEFNEVVSPRAGLLCEVSDSTIVRASVGRAFRAPTLVELYQPTLSFGYVTFEANPDLEPEYIFAADLEVEHWLSPSLNTRAAVFYNDMDDLIENVSNGSVLSNANIEEARSVGIELGLLWELADSANLFLSYTVQDAENKETGDNLDYIPESTGSLGVRVARPLGSWQLECSLTEAFVGKRGFMDWDSGQWYALAEHWRTDLVLTASRGEKSWISARVQNATDEKYQDSRMFALAPGRLMSLEIGTSF